MYVLQSNQSHVFQVEALLSSIDWRTSAASFNHGPKDQRAPIWIHSPRSSARFGSSAAYGEK
jgi:hypothetical protein